MLKTFYEKSTERRKKKRDGKLWESRKQLQKYLPETLVNIRERLNQKKVLPFREKNF